MLQTKSLSLASAQAMVDAAHAKAIEHGITIVISILDGAGNLKYFRRMDKTSFGSIRISQLKAHAAASLPFSTKKLAERSAQHPNNPYGSIPGIILLGGGLPIVTSDGQHIGGIGISRNWMKFVLKLLLM